MKAVADPEFADAAEVVELVVGHRLDQLRDARPERLGAGPDAAVIDQRRGAWQDLAERNIREVSYAGGQLRRDGFGKAAQQDAAPA